MKIFQYLLATFVASFMLIGCASKGNLAPKEVSETAKLFNPPKDGKAGLYIYRELGVGAALKKDIFINDKLIAESSPRMFFMKKLMEIKSIKYQQNQNFQIMT